MYSDICEQFKHPEAKRHFAAKLEIRKMLISRRIPIHIPVIDIILRASHSINGRGILSHSKFHCTVSQRLFIYRRGLSWSVQWQTISTHTLAEQFLLWYLWSWLKMELESDHAKHFQSTYCDKWHIAKLHLSSYKVPRNPSQNVCKQCGAFYS